MAAPPKPMVHVVLEQCSLETVKTKKGFELLNCDDHIGVCKRNGRDPSEYRPDIVHQVLLALMDSPLNKAGHLHVLMLTKKNVLIEISAHTRIPRTFKRFCGLMGASRRRAAAQPPAIPLFSLSPSANPPPRAALVFWAAVQLLHNLRVRAADSNDTLMRVLKSNVSQHIPLGCDVIGLEVDAELLDAYDLPARLLRGSGAAAGGAQPAAEAAAGGGGGGGAGKPKGSKRSRAAAEEEGAAAAATAAAAAAAGGAAAAAAGKSPDVAFVIGAMSHGNIAAPYITRTFSLSRYPLSAACTVGKLMNAFEKAWGVL